MKYYCNECQFVNPCEFGASGTCAPPERCPYFNSRMADWKEVEG